MHVVVARRRSCSPKWTHAETRTSHAVTKAGDEVGRAPAPRTADLAASHDGDPSNDARELLEGRCGDRRDDDPQGAAAPIRDERNPTGRVGQPSYGCTEQSPVRGRRNVEF